MTENIKVMANDLIDLIKDYDFRNIVYEVVSGNIIIIANSNMNQFYNQPHADSKFKIIHLHQLPANNIKY